MDYWSCALEGRVSLFSDELDFPVDAYARNRKPLAGWEPSFSELPREPLCSDHTGVFMLHSGEAVADSARNVEAYASVVRSSSSVESVSNHSSSVMESNSRDTPSSDLNLGGFADSTDGSNDKQLGRRLMFSASPIPQAKRARTLNMRSQTPLCQVYGCNKDLSSSKDYHKRHRVCDVHSKTPRVIVNGMEQRFCQQCSRFHLLIEFDEGKRSCRRRLAGHNERRRKPQFISLAGKTHGLLQSYGGGFVAPGIYEQVNWSTNVKLEEESVMIPIASSSTLHLHGSRSTCASQISSSPTENFTASTAASATTDSTRVIQSPCALSLLSANSHYLGHMARDTMVRSLSSHPNFNSHASEKCVPSGSSWSRPNLNQLKQLSSLMVYSADHPLKPNEAIDESNLLNTTLSHSLEEGSTVDLLQLSSHLQRVEQQRTYLQVKNENDDFFSFRTLH